MPVQGEIVISICRMYLERNSILEVTRVLEKDTWYPGIIERMLIKGVPIQI